MKLKNLGLKALNGIKNGVHFYMRIFYDPSLYRDIAFRQTGYGLKRVFILLFILMLPSFIGLYNQTINHYQKDWIQKLEKLPYLKLENHKLYHYNQDIRISSSINPDYFRWFNKSKIEPEDIHVENPKDFLLGVNYLWVNLPLPHYFGYIVNQEVNYIPILSWMITKEPVSGKSIVGMLSFNYIFNLILMFSLSMYIINSFMIFFFIRTFGMIAKKMVLMVLRDSLDYKMACRLLSVAAFPGLTLLALFVDMWGFQEYYKFLFLTVYMTNFYIAIRCIKAKSNFRWIRDIR
jgi:hypothetical protein